MGLRKSVCMTCRNSVREGLDLHELNEGLLNCLFDLAQACCSTKGNPFCELSVLSGHAKCRICPHHMQLLHILQ